MKTDPVTSGKKAIPVSCNKDCGGGCPLLAQITDGKIVKITNNPAGTQYMNGCIRGFQAMQEAYAPDRLLKPLVRSGPRGSGKFRVATWDEAINMAARNLLKLKNKFGSHSILFLGGSGACRGAMHNTVTLTERFLNLFGGFTQQHAYYSSAAADFVTPYMFGTNEAGIDAATLQHSKLIILWGANISVTRFSSEFPSRIREAGKNGVSIVVIDPRKSKTAGLPNTEWIKIRPGTDTAMMASILYELIYHNRVDYPYLKKYCAGFDRVEKYIVGTDDHQPKTPEWAEKICGTPAGIIKKLAERYGRIKPVALIPGLSIQRTIGGEEAFRMAVILQAVTGNIGKMGGASGGSIWGRLPRPECGRMDTACSKGNPLIPTYRWPDAVLEGKMGGYPTDIKAIYNVGGNYLSQGSDIKKNISAFNKVDFSVCHEHFMTPTASYCDVVLPATTFLEREDILFTPMNYLFYSGKAIDPPDSVKDDYDIFCKLSDRLGFLNSYSENRTASQWIELFLERSEITDSGVFKQTGVFSGKDQMRIGLLDFIKDPMKNPLKTASGKIELASDNYAKTGFPAIPAYRGLEEETGYPLRMVTPHSLHRINSSYSNIKWFREKEPQRLWMHPANAEKRMIKDRQKVIIRSSKGEMIIPAQITENIMPGVVCLHQGVWPVLGKNGCDSAGSANILTSTEPTKPSNGSRTHSIFVEVGLHKP